MWKPKKLCVLLERCLSIKVVQYFHCISFEVLSSIIPLAFFCWDELSLRLFSFEGLCIFKALVHNMPFECDSVYNFTLSSIMGAGDCSYIFTCMIKVCPHRFCFNSSGYMTCNSCPCKNHCNNDMQYFFLCFNQHHTVPKYHLTMHLFFCVLILIPVCQNLLHPES